MLGDQVHGLGWGLCRRELTHALQGYLKGLNSLLRDAIGIEILLLDLGDVVQQTRLKIDILNHIGGLKLG